MIQRRVLDDLPGRLDRRGDRQPPAERQPRHGEPQQPVEDEAVDHVARRVPVGQMLRVARTRAPVAVPELRPCRRCRSAPAPSPAATERRRHDEPRRHRPGRHPRRAHRRPPLARRAARRRSLPSRIDPGDPPDAATASSPTSARWRATTPGRTPACSRACERLDAAAFAAPRVELLPVAAAPRSTTTSASTSTTSTPSRRPATAGRSCPTPGPTSPSPRRSGRRRRRATPG